MSLTQFIKIPEIREKFAETFPIPVFNLKNPLICPPRTTHYGLVGTAFDYLLRFYIEYNNPGTITHRWVAEEAVKLTKKDANLFKKANALLQKTKKVYKTYLQSGEINDEVLKATIFLAQLDPIFRAGYIDPNLGMAEKEDIADLRSLIDCVKVDTFKSKEICVLNPTFDIASALVGGADADLVIDNTLIDVKTTKNLRLDRDQFNQLVGYYILHRLDEPLQFADGIIIDNLGIYFSRHGVLFTVPITTILNSKKIEEFIDWFENKAREYYPGNVPALSKAWK